MNKDTIQIEGFENVVQLVKKLDDKSKKKEMIKLLKAIADPTLKAAQDQAPISSGEINGFIRKKRQVGRTVLESTFSPGYGKRTIAKAVMRRTPNAVVMVGPRSRKGKDGYYLRQWVIPGTVGFAGNQFVQRAYQMTSGRVTADGKKKFENYLSRQIKRLNA